MSAPYLALFESEEQLYEFLARLNTDGHQPELPAMGALGGSFMATLTEPDADRVHYVVTNESGHAHCCNCEHEGRAPERWDPCTWRPAYPVTALCEFDPAGVRGLIALKGAHG